MRRPPRETIESLLQPAKRPAKLRDADAAVLVPDAAECLERLKLWVTDMLAELAADHERVWREVEAPELARRTDPKAIIINPDEERRLSRASTEYRTIFYRAYNTFQAKRKQEAAEARAAAKQTSSSAAAAAAGPLSSVPCPSSSLIAAADAAGPSPHVCPLSPCPSSLQGETGPLFSVDCSSSPVTGPLSSVDCPSSLASETAYQDEPSSACSVDCPSSLGTGPLSSVLCPSSLASETAYQDEPSSASSVHCPSSLAGEIEAGAGEGPSAGPETPVVADDRPAGEEPQPRHRPGGEADAERGSGPSQRAMPAVRYDPARGSEDDWRTPPPEVTRAADGTITVKESSPYLLDPNKPWDQLTPQERAAIESLRRETMTDLMHLF